MIPVEHHRSMMVWAYAAALGSRDISTQNGALIVSMIDDDPCVDAVECNNPPAGVTHRPHPPEKYHYTEHAERSAIFSAARDGICTRGSTLFCPWLACRDCARAIICSGITHVVGHKPIMDRTPDRWVDSICHAYVMFEEAGIQVSMLDDSLPECDPILFGGQLWQP